MNTEPASKPWYPRLTRFTTAVEDVLLALLVTAMIVLAAAQIVLRNIFDAGMVWADPLLRALVLWVGLLGAMVASRTENHITIDILSRFLPERPKRVARALIDLFTFLVCMVLSYYSALFVQLDMEAGTRAFGYVRAWMVELILPLGFAVIALRYGAALVNNLLVMKKEGSV